MKTVFAHEIEFIKKSGASKTPAYYQDKLLETLGDTATFNGFILPWAGVKTKCSITVHESGVTVDSCSVHTLLTQKISGRKQKNTPERLAEEASKLLEGTGQVFHAWKEFNPNDTKASVLITRCEDCGSLTERVFESLRGSKRRGSIIHTTCENCRKAMYDSAVYEKYKHLPHYLYILKVGDNHIKIGCTFREVEKRVKEIQRGCKHEVTVIRKIKFNTGYEAYAIEGDILRRYNDMSGAVPVTEMTVGQTETFPRDYLRRISRRVNHLTRKPLSLWEVFTQGYIDSMVEGLVEVPELFKPAIEDIRHSIDEYGVDLSPVL